MCVLACGVVVGFIYISRISWKIWSCWHYEWHHGQEWVGELL